MSAGDYLNRCRMNGTMARCQQCGEQVGLSSIDGPTLPLSLELSGVSYTFCGWVCWRAFKFCFVD